jgi:uncharacterized DUF497 family protein
MNESNDKYSWNPGKRELNINERGLDFVEWADFVFADPNVVVINDEKPNKDNEVRYLAFAMVGNTRICLCFSNREDKKHLITIFKMRDKRQWRRHYDKNS